VSEYLPGNAKPSGSIPFCDQPGGGLIFISFGRLPGEETTASSLPSERETAFLLS